MTITTTYYKDRERWLNDRLYTMDSEGNKVKRFVVGGSNIGTILGFDPHCTPYQLWNNYHNAEPVVNDAMYRGQFMEDAIARWFEHETGEKVIKSSAGIVVYHNDRYPDYFQCATDRELFKGRKRFTRPILECKDTRYIIDSLDDLKEKNPNWYTQCQYMCGICERDSVFLAVCDGSKQLRWVEILFDRKFFDWMAQTAQQWVERYIIGGETPPLETAEDVVVAFPFPEPKTKVVDDIVNDDCDRLSIVRKSMKELKEEDNKLKDRIAVIFEDYDTLIYEGAIIATYKANKNGQRTLRVK